MIGTDNLVTLSIELLIDFCKKMYSALITFSEIVYQVVNTPLADILRFPFTGGVLPDWWTFLLGLPITTWILNAIGDITLFEFLAGSGFYLVILGIIWKWIREFVW